MTINTEQLLVRSHVARDLLQSAGLFKTERLVVWEYVANGLQYVDVGVNPIVAVTIDNKNKRITVRDNGRGMDWNGLQNYFVMHGENEDRRSGRGGRGRFGTGKSAAFGVAGTLRITTQRNGAMSKVELRRSDIDSMNSGDGVPVKVLLSEVSTDEANGTLVEVEDIYLRKIDQAEVITFIQRHLSKWPNATVFVNNHECEFDEPPIDRTFRYKPNETLARDLGDVELTLKVSKAPLNSDARGVAIFSKGVWHETTLGGHDNKEMAQYIFGDIDIARLEDDTSSISPFDMSRSMKLNANNPIVSAAFAFIGDHVEALRRTLVTEDKQRREGEEARKLDEHANEIAKLINEDFDDYRRRVAQSTARSGSGTDVKPACDETSDDGSFFISGNEVPAAVLASSGAAGADGCNGAGGAEPRNLAPQYAPDPSEQERTARPTGNTDVEKKQRGGFHVKFSKMGVQSLRAQYTRDERTIYINLEHPQLVSALGTGTTEDLLFRRLTYEIAFSEYSIALASELAAKDEYIDPIDPIVDIRETINRLARRGAALFAAVRIQE